MSDWVDIELGEFVELKRGYDLPKKNREDGTVPIVSSSGESGYHNEPKAKGPGVITGRYGTIGKVFYIEEDFWPLNTTLYVKDFKGNEPLFVYYFLKTISYSDYSDKAAVPGINRNHLHKAKIRVPVDPVYQRELATKLWDLDKKIELNRQTNQTLEQIAQAIFKSWFVDFEPVKAKVEAKQNGQDPEFAAMCAISGKSLEELEQLSPETQQQLKTTASLFPGALVEYELVTNSSGTNLNERSEPVGEGSGTSRLIPEGWKYSEIGSEVTVVGGGTPSTKKSEFWEGGHIHWTTPKDMSNLTDKILLETDRKITEAGLAKISSGLLPENTVLMSSRAPVGYLAIAKIPVAVNQGYIAMKCESELSPEYVMQWAESVMGEIKQRASGTTFAEISKKNFKVIQVIVPDVDVVSEYSRIVSDIYSKVTEVIRETKYLAEARDTLLSKLLSGDLPLKQPKDQSDKKVVQLKQKTKANDQFKEAVLIAKLTQDFSSEQFPLGRERYTKLSYLFHRKCEDHALRRYLKKTAGPYAPWTRYQGPENIAKTNGYIVQASRGVFRGFRPGPNIANINQYFSTYWEQSNLTWLLKVFKFRKKEELELLATVDMAMRNVLEQNKKVSLAAVKIIIESEPEWMPKLNRKIFSDKNINKAITEHNLLFL